MKRYKVILAGMLLGLSLTGCEGFLDREPWDSIDATKGFQSEGEAQDFAKSNKLSPIIVRD